MGCCRDQVDQPFLFANVSSSISCTQGCTPGWPRRLFLSLSQVPSTAPEVTSVGTPGLACLRAVMKPLTEFLWLWVHGTGPGKTPGLVRGPSIPSQPPRSGCSPMGPASPSRPSSSPLDLCPSRLTLCSPSLRLPCFYPGLCQWHCLGKKLRLAHLAVFFFFAGQHHQFTPTLCLAFQVPTAQPRLPSHPHHPALRPHCPLPRRPPPLLHVHPDPLLCIV